ncbi:unnamed protein product [Gordionus sp. m RMFG-2023]
MFRQNFVRGAESMGGASFAAYHNGKLVADLWGGFANIKGGQKSFLGSLFAKRSIKNRFQQYDYYWLEDTLTHTLSATKGMAALVIGHLQDNNKLNIDDPVAKYWPQFRIHDKGNITIAHILTHTAGLPYIDPSHPITFKMLKENSIYTEGNTLKDLDTELSKILADQKPAWSPPGIKRGYHVFTLGLYLDQIVRRCDTPKRRSISRYFDDEIAKKFDLDFFIGLPSRDINARVAILRNERFLKTLSGFFQKLKFGLMIYTHPMTKKALLNPDMIVKTQTMALNRPEVRNLQFPSVIGIGDARSLAKVYGILANQGNNNQQLLKPETLQRMIKQTSSSYDKDVIFGDMYKFAMSTGFILMPNPNGQTNFGFPGHGLQLAFGDPNQRIGYAYLTNTVANDQLNDRRGRYCVDALYKALNASRRGLEGSVSLEDKARSDIIPDKSTLEHLTKSKPPHLEKTGILSSLWGFVFHTKGNEEKQHSKTDAHLHRKGYFDMIRHVISDSAHKLKGAKSPKDLKTILDNARKSVNSVRSDPISAHKISDKYFESKDYLEGTSSMILDAAKWLSNAGNQDSKAILDLAGLYISGIKDFVPGMNYKDYFGLAMSNLKDAVSDVTEHHEKGPLEYLEDTMESLTRTKDDVMSYPHKKGYFEKAKNIIIESAYKLQTANSAKDIKIILDNVRKSIGSMSDKFSKHKISDKYYDSKDYIEGTSSMILDAARRLSSTGNEDAQALLDQAGHYISGIKEYVPGIHQKGYFELAGDKLSNIKESVTEALLPHEKEYLESASDSLTGAKNNIIETFYPHKKGYFEKAKNIIIESAHKLQTANSAKDIKIILDNARKSISSMSDKFSKHKISDKYYDSKDYIEGTSSMILDAARRLSSAGNKDAQDLLDQAGHYISGIKEYVPGMHQKGYFELAGDKLSSIKDSVTEALLPHEKGYLESAVDSLTGAKDNIIETFYPHKRGYFEKTRDTIIESAHKLKSADSPKNIKIILDEARKSINSMSDKFSKHKISDKYYDSKDYIEGTTSMILDAARRLSSAGNEDAQALLDQAGHYISGIKEYVPGMHQKGYFELAGDKLSSIKDSVTEALLPHEKGYLESALDSLTGAKNNIIETFYPHKKGYFEIAKNIIIESAYKLQTANSAKDIKIILDNVRKSIGSMSDKFSKHKISDKYYDSKDYIEGTSSMILDAARRLSSTGNEDAQALLDQAGHYISGIKEYVPGMHQKGYFELAGDKLSSIKESVTEALLPHEKGYLESASDSLTGAKNNIIETFYPHKKGYFEKTKNIIIESAHKLQTANSAKDIKIILDNARKSISSMSDKFSKHKISDKYYDSKDYIKGTSSMILDAARRLSSAGNKDAQDLLDQAGHYISGIKEYVPGMHQKGYFELAGDKLSSIKDSVTEALLPHEKGYLESAVDSITGAKDNIIETFYPHKRGYFEKTRDTIIESAHKLKNADSPKDIKIILEEARKSINSMSDKFSKHKISDKYYDSKDYIEGTTSMILDAARRLSSAGNEDAQALLDQAGHYISGIKDYVPGMHKKGYFELAGDKLSSIKDSVTEALLPHEKGYLESAVDSLTGAKDNIIETFYPHKRGYFEKTRDTIIESAHKLKNADSPKDIKIILDEARKSINSMSDKFSKHKISDKYYDSKDYIEKTTSMISDAARRLSSAGNEDAQALLDQAGHYISGIKEYVPGMHKKGYFELAVDRLSGPKDKVDSLYHQSKGSLESDKYSILHHHTKSFLKSVLDALSNIKEGIIDSLYPRHESTYLEKTGAAILQAAHRLENTNSPDLIKTTVDTVRSIVHDLGHHFTDDPNLLKRKLSDTYYDTKTGLDATQAVLIEAAKRLPRAGAQDAKALIHLVALYLLGDYNSEIFSANIFHRHPESYFHKARDMIMHAAQQLNGVKSSEDIKSILDKTRMSFTDASDHFLDIVKEKRHKYKMGEAITDAYYNSKSYLDSSAAMIIEAAKQLSLSGTKDADSIMDQTGKYLIGIKEYIINNNPSKSYFDTSKDKLSNLMDSVSETFYPHKRGYLESSINKIFDIKNGIIETIYPHQKNYYDRTKDIIMLTAHELSRAKSTNIKSILDKARKSITDASDHFTDLVKSKKHKNSMGESISDAYYNSKDYLDHSANMIIDASKRLSHASSDEANEILDQAGKYMIGMKDYIIGNHPKGYFDTTLDKLTGMKNKVVESVHPHKPGYLENVMHYLDDMKVGIIDSLYPHQDSYYEKARNTVFRTANQLSEAKSSDIKSILDKARESITDASDHFTDLVRGKKHKNSMGESISDAYYNSKDYLDHSANMIIDASKRLSHASSDEANEILDQAGKYMIGMKDYITGNHPKGYFDTTLDKLTGIKNKVVESVHPHKPGYLENVMHYLDDMKVGIIDSLYPHQDSYYEKARNTVFRTANQLSGAKSSDIKSILDKARESITDASDHFTDLVRGKKHKNSMGESISDAYYNSKDYLDHSANMIIDASKRLSHASSDEANEILDQAGKYMIGMKDYITGNHPKGYFDTTLDKLTGIKNKVVESVHPHKPGYLENVMHYLDDMKVGIIDSLYPHQDSYYEKARNTVFRTANQLSGAKSSDIKSILDKARESITDASDHFTDLVRGKKHKNSMGESISDAYYNSKDYLDHSANMIIDASKRLSHATSDEANEILDQTGRYMIGMKDYITGNHPKGYFDTTLDKLTGMKNKVVESVHPHKPGYLENVMHYLDDMKVGIIDSLYPHQDSYYEKARNTVFRTANQLSGAKSSDIKSILDKARESITDASDHFTDLVRGKKHKNSMGESISDAYYDSKDYLDHSANMIIDASKRLSHASSDEANEILDQAGKYMIGMKDYITGNHPKGYFDTTLDKLTGMKNKVVESVHPHKPGYLENVMHYLDDMKVGIIDSLYPHQDSYYEKARNTVFRTANQLSGAKSSDIKSILDKARESITDASDHFTDLVRGKKHKNSMGESISDAYYNSKDYLDHSANMIIDASKRLSHATSDEANEILDQTGRYMIGMKDYITGNHPKGYFDTTLDKLTGMKNKVVESVHPHKPGYLENVMHYLDDMKVGIIDSLYPHQDSYYEKARNTVFRTANQLSGAKSSDIKSILDKARESITDASDHFTDLVRGKKHKNSMGESISDAYYNSKEYLDHSANMIIDASKRLSLASSDETNAILDQTGKYMIGIKDYITGNYPKGYFDATLNKLSGMKNKVVESVHPHKPSYLENVMHYLDDIKVGIIDLIYPHQESYYEKARDTIIHTAHQLSGSKSGDIKSILDKARESITDSSDHFTNLVKGKKHKNSLGESISDSYYSSKAYLDSTAAIIIDAAKHLSNAGSKDAQAILDQTGQYLIGVRNYVTHYHHPTKSYFDLTKDRVSGFKDNIVEHFPHKKGYLEGSMDILYKFKDDVMESIYPHRKGYFEKARETIINAAHQINGAQSQSAVKSIIDKARKSLTEKSEHFAKIVMLKKHDSTLMDRLSDDYYDSKSYVESTAAMLIDSAKRLSSAGVEDTHSIIDQTSQYLVGVKDYIIGNHPKSYFELTKDRVTDMKDTIIDNIYPHHRSNGYFDKAKQTIMRSALQLSGAKSPHDTKSIVENARKSLTDASEYFKDAITIRRKEPLKETILENYYDSKYYIESTAALILETAKRLTTAGAQDAQAVLHATGQYVVGLKEFALPGQKSNSYLDVAKDKVAEIVDAVSSPKKALYHTVFTNNILDKLNRASDAIFNYIPLPFVKKEKSLLERFAERVKGYAKVLHY